MTTSDELLLFIKRYLFISESSLFTIAAPENIPSVNNVSFHYSPHKTRCVNIFLNDKASCLRIIKHCGFHTIERRLMEYMVQRLDCYLRSAAYSFHELNAMGQAMQVSAICHYLLHGEMGEPLGEELDRRTHILSECIENLDSWSSQTYEGKRISFSVGFDYLTKGGSGVFLEEYFDEDVLKVLTSGHVSLLTCDGNGEVAGHEGLLGRAVREDLFTPVEFSGVAAWTGKGRVALILNAQGEILVFCRRSLLFAKRRGKWSVFLHKQNMAILHKESQSFNRDVGKAIYQTALDVSFLRTGGCIGFVRDNCADLIPPGERPCEGNEKSRLLTHLSAARPFHEIPRLLRAELVSVDGATVVFRDGRLLALGAILNIATDGATPSGGRTVAAKNLAQHGVGIKISNDGKIQSWAGSSSIPQIEMG